MMESVTSAPQRPEKRKKTTHNCSECGKSFSQKSALKQHKSTHKAKILFHCSECGKSFSEQQALKDHQKSHKEGKLHHCSECGKSFSEQKPLKDHEKSHKEVKPHHCSGCGKSFVHPGQLLQHQHLHGCPRKHQRKQSYQCSECGESFDEQSSLHQHQQTHTGERHSEQGRSFDPQMSAKAYSYVRETISVVRVQEEFYLTEPAPVVPVLPHRSEAALLLRVEREFPGSVTAYDPSTPTEERSLFTGQSGDGVPSSPAPSNSACTVTEDGGNFTFNIAIAPPAFNHPQEQQSPESGEKPYQCSECGESFAHRISLRLHQQTHTGEMSHHCSECGESFAQLSSLLWHLQTHTGGMLFKGDKQVQ